jgi:hypothetical protein
MSIGKPASQSILTFSICSQLAHAASQYPSPENATQLGKEFPYKYVVYFRYIKFHRFTSSFSKRSGYCASTRIRIRCLFKGFHSGERFQKFAVTVCVFVGYVWTESVSATKCLRIQTNLNTCGRGLNSIKFPSEKIRHSL